MLFEQLFIDNLLND